MYVHSALICESSWNRVDSTWSVMGRFFFFLHATGHGTFCECRIKESRARTWATPIENKTLNPIRSLVRLLRAAFPVHRPVAPTACSFKPGPNAAIAQTLQLHKCLSSHYFFVACARKAQWFKAYEKFQSLAHHSTSFHFGILHDLRTTRPLYMWGHYSSHTYSV